MKLAQIEHTAHRGPKYAVASRDDADRRRRLLAARALSPPARGTTTDADRARRLRFARVR